MKKQLAILLMFLLAGFSYAQDEVDIGTPTDSPFQLGGDIQGTIQNSVNEVTGKVTFSAPLASIAASSVSYGVSLSYNGQIAFKNGQQTNKYNPTSVAGVGWSLGFPKIVVDNKNTGTRDDDVFYLLDGATNTKLICTNKGTTTNGSVWEFQMEKYAPWKIEFYYHTTWGDYWKITNESGLTYYYGNPTANQARDHVVRYGNWIGSSKQSGASAQQTIEWNLYKMEDQWGNNLIFEYDTVTQTMSGYAQTEASYLKKITSSNGANIQLTYGSKDLSEYYEPHQEASEPDAYQERYEKKYLQNVSSYNNENQLVSTYNIGYALNGTGLNKKRYLTSLAQTIYNNGLNETLPAQSFEYHYTGSFKGGIEKITYPAGGSVTYNYSNKTLFTNSGNKFSSSFTWPSGYIMHSKRVKDNYSLYVLRTTNKVSGDKYRFKIFRFWWNGEAWEHNEFTFPHLIEDGFHWDSLQNFYSVFEDDFYGFVCDKGTTADVYLFHLENDGRTWDYYTSTSRSVGGNSTNTNDFPTFISANKFAALSSYRTGLLYTYVWNGSSWNYKLINQGSGTYYVAATNNYIIALDEDGYNDGDLITSVSHADYYYMHYLDAEKNWQTKSWSAVADPHTNGIEKASYFYPDNSIIGFVADDNPELFLRWDTNYNLTNVDNVLGSYDDKYPLVPVGNSMFTLHHNITNRPYKTARFNGVNWNVTTPTATDAFSYMKFGRDLLNYENIQGYSNNDVKYYMYNPNSSSWVSNILYYPSSSYASLSGSAINSDFIVVGKKFYEKSNLGYYFNEIGTLSSDNIFCDSDGLSHTFIEKPNHLNGGYFCAINKNNNLLSNTLINGMKYGLQNMTDKFGGYRPFISPNSISFNTNSRSGTNVYLYQHPIADNHIFRVIDDELNNVVNDIVVNHLDINDDNGSLRKVQYTYNKPKCAPDNSSTFYGEVIIENKGIGTGNIGKVVKKFNDGSTDLSMVGLPMEVLTKDSNNNLVKRTTMTWNKYTKSFSNGSDYFYNSYYIRGIKEKEELFFTGSPDVVSETTNTYNTYGLKTASYSTNSKGKTVRQDVSYAYQYYTFVNDKNMLSFPYQTTTKINNVIVNVEQSKWINDNGKVYINENWSGPSTSTLRLNSKISKVESTTGNVLENNNGKGLYNAVLFGYDNLYEVATISNAKYQDVVDELDVTYAQLQGLTTANLKTELLKLYDRLPNAGISLSFYDNNGRVISRINGREEESFVYYDTVGRQDYITDAQGNILEKKEYHFSN